MTADAARRAAGPNYCDVPHPPTDTCVGACGCTQIVAQLGPWADLHPGPDHVNMWCGTVWPVYPTAPGEVLRYAGPATLHGAEPASAAARRRPDPAVGDHTPLTPNRRAAR